MKKSVILFLLIILSWAAQAQGRLGIGLHSAIPVDEFRKATDYAGVGFNLHVLAPFVKGVPVYGGFEFGYLLYGSNTQRQTLYADVTVGNTVIDRIEIPLKVTTNNNLYHGHLILRAQAPLPVVQPYIEGLIGFRYYNTVTKIVDDSDGNQYSDDENGVIVRSNQLGDWVGSWGFGGGLHIELKPDFFLDLRCDYLYGGKAQFYDADDTEQWNVEFTTQTDWNPETVTGDDLEISAEPKRSFTNSVFATLGIAVVIGGEN